MNAGERKLCFSFLCCGPGLLESCMDLELEPLASISSLLFLGNALRTIIEMIPQPEEKLKPDRSGCIGYI